MLRLNSTLESVHVRQIVGGSRAKARERGLQSLAARGVASASLAQDCLAVAVGLEEGNEGLEDGDVVLFT